MIQEMTFLEAAEIVLSCGNSECQTTMVEILGEEVQGIDLEGWIRDASEDEGWYDGYCPECASSHRKGAA